MTELDEEKLFYERFWSLMRNERLVEIYKHFGYEAFRRSSVLEGFERFVDDNGFCGDTCIEIGTLKGLTAVVLAQRFRRVISVDIIDDPLKWSIVKLLGINNVVMLNVEDNQEKARVIDEFTFDAAYLDGNHEKDTLFDYTLVSQAKKILFHEHWGAQPAVIRMVDRLRTLGTVKAGGKFALWTA